MWLGRGCSDSVVQLAKCVQAIDIKLRRGHPGSSCTGQMEGTCALETWVRGLAAERGLSGVVPKADGAAVAPGQVQLGRYGGETAHSAQQLPNVCPLVRSVFEHDGSVAQKVA